MEAQLFSLKKKVVLVTQSVHRVVCYDLRMDKSNPVLFDQLTSTSQHWSHYFISERQLRLFSLTVDNPFLRASCDFCEVFLTPKRAIDSPLLSQNKQFFSLLRHFSISLKGSQLVAWLIIIQGGIKPRTKRRTWNGAWKKLGKKLSSLYSFKGRDLYSDWFWKPLLSAIRD